MGQSPPSTSIVTSSNTSLGIMSTFCALLLRIGMWLACRAYACVVRVFIKHTISLYISSFTPLYVYTCIRPIIFSPSPALHDSRDAKTAPPLQSSSSNRRRAHSDAVVEPRSMSLTGTACNFARRRMLVMEGVDIHSSWLLHKWHCKMVIC